MSKTGCFQSSIVISRESIRLGPNFAEAHKDLGMILALQGKTQ